MKRKTVYKLLAILMTMAIVSCGGMAKKQQALAPIDTIDYSGLVTSGPKKRVAISEFVNKTAYGRGRLGTSASDKLATHLVKSKGFIVVEREQMAKLMGEQALGMSGAVNPDTAAKAGNVLGAQVIIVGSISDFGYKKEGNTGLFVKEKRQVVTAKVDIRAIDTTTGRILFAESGRGVAENRTEQVLGMGGRVGYDETLNGKALERAIVQLTTNIIKNLQKIEWTGKIAKVSDNGNIYVNAGRLTGLRIGDLLTAATLGEMIIDPDTGLAMGREEGNPKGKIKVTQFFGSDGAICQVEEGSGFEKGDQVKLSE